MVFFDTNVIVYSDDDSQPAKQKRAIELIRESAIKQDGAISMQVLQEYFVVVTRKLSVDAAVAQRKVENLVSTLAISRVTEQDVIKAIQLHRLNRISYWDALIVTAAMNVKAAVLYSEDMQSSRMFGGTLKIVNPFEESRGNEHENKS
jgi:predicted nucleic acid-binding protein